MELSVRGRGSYASNQDDAEKVGPARDDAAQRALDALRVSDRSDSRQQALLGVRRALAESRRLLRQPFARVLAIATGTVLVALLIAVAFVVRISEQPAPPSSVSSPMPTASTSSTTIFGGSVIAVAGAVRTPGVYRVAQGARVVDALEIAGGPAEDIDLDRLNLAAPVTDGERVWFPRVGEAPPSVVAGPESARSAAQGTDAGPIDLNSATLEQLDSLPGVGPTTARAILDRRTEIGRFRSVEDLLSVKGIGASKLDAIRSTVVVR
jgi:competence protein ComEA